jgi:hypothetical protein
MTFSQRPTLKSLLMAATILACPLIVVAPAPAAAQTACPTSVQLAPPVLPDYSQPPLPAYGYIWTPCFWSWSDPVGYYWVPGTWVQPPVVGLLWTPPYWGWANGAYVFNGGYWGPQVGYYGGVNYGYGYGGLGYEGGHWDNGRFTYNRTANNFGTVHISDVYTKHVTIINNTHVSYVGGTGGLTTQPTAQERLAEQDHHVALTAEQQKHIATAAATPALAASRNNGHPAIAATSHPAQFNGPGVVRAQPEGIAEHTTAPAIAPHPTAAGTVPALRPPPEVAEHAVAHPVEAAPAHSAEEHVTAPNAAAPHLAGAREPLAERPAPQPAEHALVRPVEATQARPADVHVIAPNAAAPHPAASREPLAEHPAPQPAEHALVRPAEAVPARPAEQHAAAPAPHPAAAHEAPAAKGEEKKKEL